jgi:hypothetical protein
MSLSVSHEPHPTENKRKTQQRPADDRLGARKRRRDGAVIAAVDLIELRP